ncbi:retrovirus-related pol polyprotein from transposon TNT 1-94 [Tanacetum coccineum]
METIHVQFDELYETMAHVHISSGPEPIVMMPGQNSSGLVPNQVPTTNYGPPTNKDLEILFQPMFDEYFEQPRANVLVPSATTVNAQVVTTGTSISTTFAQDAPSLSNSPSSSEIQPPVFNKGVAAGPTFEDNLLTQAALHPSVNPLAGEHGSAESSSGDVRSAETNQVTQPPDHLRKWTKDHPIDNVVGNPSRPVSTRKQLASNALWCCYHSFDRLKVWELVPRPVYVMVIALKWIYKVKLHEHGDVLKNKARLVAKGYRQEEEGSLRVKAGFKGMVYTLSKFLMATKFFKGAVDPTNMEWNLSDPFRTNDTYGGSNRNWYEELIDSRRSTSGSAQFLGEKLVSWSSKKQRSTAISTTEAEYIAMSGCLDILRNTKFFRAFSASASVPAIYLQQFWNTITYDEKTRIYNCQLDEQWFNLNADFLRKALEIILVDPTYPFKSPPDGEAIMDFCLTGKTSSSDKPIHPVLQMLWGIVTRMNVDHAELLWEEFTQGIQMFFSHKASLKNPTKKPTPILILYGRFTKLII